MYSTFKSRNTAEYFICCMSHTLHVNAFESGSMSHLMMLQPSAPSPLVLRLLLHFLPSVFPCVPSGLLPVCTVRTVQTQLGPSSKMTLQVSSQEALSG